MKMMNENYFLIIYTEDYEILIVKKKSIEKWEIPRISSTKELPIRTLIDNYLQKYFTANFKIIGQSEVIDKYEWPKELVSVTGKTGEEHRFILIKLESHFNNTNINKDTDIESYDLVEYDILCNKVIFKNHRKVLWDVIQDVKKKEKKIS